MASDRVPCVKAIVVTTINPPTEGIKTLTGRGWDVYVVGDKYTPGDWDCDGTCFFPIDGLTEFDLEEHLPTSHYSRKNIGYLAAMHDGAEAIYETDDDHLLYDYALDELSESLSARTPFEAGWLNVYDEFTDGFMWPRGFPLQEVNIPSPYVSTTTWSVNCPIQQFLVDGDPDVDAVYRMTRAGASTWNPGSSPLALGYGTFSPFNSQNTLWYPSAYPYMYLPSYVSFRVTDIWRSFIAHRCIAEDGDYVAFRSPNARQDRNPHDLLKDFEDEIPGYLLNAKIVDKLWSLDLRGMKPTERLLYCYARLAAIGAIKSQEIPLVDAWISDLP